MLSRLDIMNRAMAANKLSALRHLGGLGLLCPMLWACDPGGPVTGTPTGADQSSGPSAPVGPVIASDRWIVAPLTVDPQPEHQPPQPWECKPGSFRVENGSFEVETGSCAYGLFAQPLLVPLRAGQPLHMVAWHLILSNPEPAHGHMALYIGDELLFEVSPAIPGPAASYDREIVLTKDHPAGEVVLLHIHNHGINNWNLLSLETMMPK